MPTADDPLDQLVPRVRPWWQRLIVGGGVVAVVGVLSVLWRFGGVYPQPDVGRGVETPLFLRLADDGGSVEIATSFWNGSQHPLRITDARADLPGAQVVSIAVLDAASVLPLPATAAPEPTGAIVVVRFVPATCTDGPRPWGTVELDLEVDGRLPSLGRTYRLPHALVPAGEGWPLTDAAGLDIAGLDIAGLDAAGLHAAGPLAAACRLLGRS